MKEARRELNGDTVYPRSHREELRDVYIYENKHTTASGMQRRLCLQFMQIIDPRMREGGLRAE